MKRLLSIILALSLIMSTEVVYAAPSGTQESRTDYYVSAGNGDEIEEIRVAANEELWEYYNIPRNLEIYQPKNVNNQPFRPITNGKGETLLIYGGVTTVDNDIKTKKIDGTNYIMYRYLGETISGGLYTNYLFPPDTTDNWTYLGILNNKNDRDEWEKDFWRADPYYKEHLKLNNKIPETLDSIFNRSLYTDDIMPGTSKTMRQILAEQIVRGMVDTTPERVWGPNPGNKSYTEKEDKVSELLQAGIDWTDYVLILQPPTYVSYGVGMMVHDKNGIPLYTTFGIAPLSKAPLVKSKYVIVSSGFVNDKSTATVDFVDSSGYLTFNLNLLQQAYLDFEEEHKSVDSIGELSDVEYESILKQIHKNYTTTDSGWLQKAVTLFKQIIKEPNIGQYFEKYLLLVREINRVRGLLSDDYIDNIIGIFKDELSLLLAQYILDNPEIAEEFVANRLLYSSRLLYKGTDINIGKGYYSLQRLNNDIANIFKDQVGIDKRYEDKFKDTTLEIILYKPFTVGAWYANAMPKEVIKRMLDAYTEDLVKELNNINIEDSDGKFGSVTNIINKWKTNTWITHGLDESIASNYELYNIRYNTDQSYGDYDDNSDGGQTFKSIAINENVVQNLFTSLATAVYFGGSKREIEVDGKETTLGDILQLKALLIGGGADSVSQSRINFDKLSEGASNEFSRASSVNKSTVEAVTMVAATESATLSEVDILENPSDGKISMSGEIGMAVAVYDKSIPIDLIVVSRTEDGKTLPLASLDTYAKAVPNILKVLKLSPNMTIENKSGGSDININITKAIIKPAYEDLANFLNKADTSLNNGKQYIDVGNTRTYFKEAPFEINNISTTLGNNEAEDIIDSGMMYSLTNEDAAAYHADEENNRPAIIVYVESGDDSSTVEPIDNNTSIVSGDITLTQKRITKAFNLNDIGGRPTFNFSYESAGRHYGYHGEENSKGEPKKSYDNRSDAVDSDYECNVEVRTATTATAIGTLGRFRWELSNSSKSGRASWSGGSVSVQPNVNFVAQRAKDLPTIAAYKFNGTNPLSDLGVMVGNTPQNNRNTTGGYVDNVSITMGYANGDYRTSFECDCGDSKRQSWTMPGLQTRTASLAVQSYIGRENSGNATTNFKPTSFKNNNVTFSNGNNGKVTGYAVNNSKLIKFYPYVEMLYQIPNGMEGKVNVLAQHESSIKPVDYVDIGWFNSSPSNSLTLNSTQWSTHARAVSQWGNNAVLPGGSIYSLDTKQNQTKVGVTTWQTYIPAEQLNAVTTGSDYYTIAAANSRDTKLNDDIKKALDRLDIVQYIDRDSGKSNAFGGIKLNASGGQNVYGNLTNNDAKYWLKRNTPLGGYNANEADLDILSENKVKTYYKVNSDINGNVIISVSTNGTTWTELQRLSKTQTAANITNTEAKELDDRTKLVTNFIAALDRNQGDDPTAGGTWYNEAWDGLCVVKIDTIYNIGLKTPAVRSAVIDPKLTPVKQSKSDIFTKYYISQFRLNEKSSEYNNKPNGYIGTIGSTDIIIPDIQSMYQSRRFYITNATVMDLY